ncbi:MAG TPA: hypothetical protein DCY27_12365 [Desulfobacterales bacterium]|nr:hypothetical protein [Desulfobacterales bacterium]
MAPSHNELNLLRVIHQNFSPDYLLQIILHALDHRQEASVKSRKFLEKVINRVIEIRGFRPLGAPHQLISEAILQKMATVEALLYAVLRVWSESRKDLHQAVKDFCEKHSIDLWEKVEAAPDSETLNQILSGISKDFISEQPGPAPEDVKLMLWCKALGLLEKLSTSQEEQEMVDVETASPEEEQSMFGIKEEFWHRWLGELQQLKADAPEWDEIDHFITAVQQLAIKKKAEREVLDRLGGLREALSTLKAEAAATFGFFGFTDIATWEAESVPPKEAPALVEDIGRLQEKLLKHRETRGLSPGTLTEEEDQRQILRALEQEILSLHHRLAADITPPEATPEAEPPEVEKEAEPEDQEMAGGEPEEATVEEAPSREAEMETKEEAFMEEEVIEEADVEPTEEPEGWEAYFWKLVAQDDLTGAYWLSRSLEAQQAPLPVPSQIMAAVQGVRWLKDDGGDLADDLVRLAAQIDRPDKRDEVVMLGLAAALRGCLILPPNDMIDWLQVPHCLKPAGGELVGAVQDFVQRGCSLFSMDLLEAGRVEERQRAIKEVSQKVKRWLEEAPAGRLKIRRASLVWSHMVRKDLSDLLEAVKADNRGRVEEVRRNLKQWKEATFIGDQIDRIDRIVSELKKNPIVGVPRNQMIRDVQEISQEAERWCTLVDLDRKVSERGDWLFNQAISLRERVQNALPEVEAILDRSGGPFSLVAAGQCLRRSLSQIRATLKLSPESAGQAEDPWNWLLLPGQSLEWALNRRLLLLPDIPLENDYVPTESEIGGVAQALREAGMQEDPLLRAFEGYLAIEDYRFLESDLLPALSTHPDTATLEKRYQDARQTSRADLSIKIQETGTAIEQALIDGIISDQDHSAYDSQVTALDSEQELNFRPQKKKLDNILTNLRKARKDRLDQLKNEWQQVEGRLTLSLISQDRQEIIRTAVKRSIKDNDTRVLEEHLAHLNQVLDGEEDLDPGWFITPAPRRKGISDFLTASREIEENLKKGPMQWRDLETCLREGRTWAGLKFGAVPRPRRDEAVNALKAWLSLKQGSADSRNTRLHLITLLQYLGFSLDTGRPSAVVIEEKIPHELRATGYMSASDLAKPIPQFGSLAGGQYDVICLWERPDAVSIAAKLLEKRLGQHPVVLLFLGRRPNQQRRDLVRRELSATAVLDETLLVFLAQESDNRLPTFLRCSLPFATLIPYTPFQAGDVPPEMFYGRQDMVRELQKPTGSCLVYGGRQLGKSALLRHVKREFHHPERGQYAHVKDIKLVGDPKADQPAQTIWRILRDALRETGLLSEKIITEDPKEIEKRLRGILGEDKNRKILILFDEADNFFEADFKDNFKEVERFRALMFESGRRFRVAFAGLNSVLRFQGIPNQPFAHFGSPLCVGALEPHAARQLVKEPVEALGYSFSDEALILRILSYTNYHPGLIQLFCQTLLQELHRRVGLSLPPYRIDRNDVEAVYLKDNIRREIRNRLEWTLALDKRYQAIAWTMIVEQQQERDSYARTFQVGEVLELVRKTYWPKGFSQTTSEQLKTLMDEMCALNILVRNTSGEYRLRSPNLVRLLGTETEIESRIIELMDETPPEPFDEQGHHAPLDEKAQRYSPFLYYQSGQLKQEKFGVGLVFSSAALGLALVPQAFSRFIPEDFPGELSDCSAIPVEVNNGNQLSQWLPQYLGAHPKHQRLIVYRVLTGSPAENLSSLVNEGLTFCRRYQQARQKWLRLFFIFDPLASWQWLSLPTNLRKGLEDAADAIVITRHWNAVGIRQRLEQTGKQDTEDILRQIQIVTGGWPLLLDELFDRCGKKDNPLPFLETIKNDLADPQTPLHIHFRDNLGVVPHSPVFQVLQYLLKEEEIDRELFTPEFMDADPALSNDIWDRSLEHLIRLGCVNDTAATFRIDPIVQQVLGE